MTTIPNAGDKQYHDDLLFKTIDGNDIGLDVIISYRIDPQKAPFIVQYVAVDDFELKDKSSARWHAAGRATSSAS